MLTLVNMSFDACAAGVTKNAAVIINNMALNIFSPEIKVCI